MITKYKVIEDLKRMGVKSGDTLYVRADLRLVGMSLKQSRDIIDAFLEVIGNDGTLVGVAFNYSSFIKRDKTTVFDGTNKPYTGTFSRLMLDYPNSYRSTHPSNSYVAIGKHAKRLMAAHTEESGAYDPIRSVIELNGKMILLGCVRTSPGFTTTHLAECDLGYHKKIIFPTLNTMYYKKDGDIKLFKRKDIGSCSSVYTRFYEYYVKEEVLIQGYVGYAYSLMINASDAYAIDLDVLKARPKIVICSNKDCFICRARRWDNLLDVIPFIIRRLFKSIKNRFFN